MGEMIVHCKYDRLVPIAELKAHPKNRNKHPQGQIQAMAKVLSYQGWRYPVKVSNLSGFITSGHGRIEAAKANGWTHVPVNFQDYASEEQEYADVQGDNAIAAWAELDLAAINLDLADLGPDFDLDVLGLNNFVLEPATKYQPPLVTGQTTTTQADDLEKFIGNSLRNVILVYGLEDHERFVELVDKAKEHYETPDASEAVMKCLEGLFDA